MQPYKKKTLNSFKKNTYFFYSNRINFLTSFFLLNYT
jgi:hypothetical protein